MTTPSQPMNAAHTSGPWTIDDDPNSNYGCQIAANTVVKAKRVVCRLGGPDRQANAALIVEAVNSNASLKARIAELEERCEATETANTDISNEGLVHLNRALIAEARIAELEGALRFYADGRRYQGTNQNPIPNDPYAKPDAVYIQDVTRDRGYIASAVLQSKGAE